MAIASRQERYEAEHQKRMTLYRLGMTDAQIAAALQVPIPTIVSWRRREGLAPNRTPRKARVTTPGASHPWRHRTEPAAPAAPTVDPVTQAAATCDAMAAASPTGRRMSTDFPVMFRVEIPTGRILVDRRPWWLRRADDNAGVGH